MQSKIKQLLANEENVTSDPDRFLVVVLIVWFFQFRPNNLDVLVLFLGRLMRTQATVIQLTCGGGAGSSLG